MSHRLAGKRCLIVGGTSGIGLASARSFLAEGAIVVIAGRNDEHAAAALQQLPGVTRCIPCDCTKAGEVEALFQAAVSALDGLDVLLHSAGGSGRSAGDAALHACSDEGWQMTLDLNLKSVFLTNREAVKQFLGRRRSGVILNVASVLPLSPSPTHFDTCAYTAAKGGIISLSRYAAARYAGQGIRVNVIAPGLIDTPMSRRAVEDDVVRSYLESRQPLARGPGSSDDCAAAAVFLCSEESRLVTGFVLPVDGGWCVTSDA